MAVALKLLGFSLWLIIMAFLVTGGKSRSVTYRKKMRVEGKKDNASVNHRKCYKRQPRMDRLPVVAGNNLNHPNSFSVPALVFHHYDAPTFF